MSTSLVCHNSPGHASVFPTALSQFTSSSLNSYLRDTFIDESPIETTNVVPPSAGDPAYNLRVVSGLPRGSGCSQFNGYEIRRRDPETTNVIITHHEVADPRVACTADYPLVETIVPLGSNFESGIDYTITVNSETAKTFTAR